MKKRTLSFLLALVMCLSLLPMTALAASPSLTLDKDNYQSGEWITLSYTDVPLGAYIYLVYADSGRSTGTYTVQSFEWYDEFKTYAPREDGAYEFRVFADWNSDGQILAKIGFTVGSVKTGNISLPQTEYTANTQIVVDYSGITEEMANAGAFIGIYKAEAEHGVSGYFDGSGNVAEGSGQVELSVPNNNGEFEVRLYNSHHAQENHFVKSVPFTISGATASEWAVDELEKAEELGLIPEILDGADLTADITRAEFAAVAVKVYENLANGEAIPAVINPFTDTKDVEILKAYNIGAVNGTSATTYSPDDLLNREQAAAMLTRVFKKISIPNWTLATDSQFALPYEKPALFADDADISDWAKESVYFMVANGIINGVGNNKFAPKNVTTEEQAQGYANATREQALLIAVRMVENLK